MQLIDRDKLKSALNNEIISHDIGNIYDRYYREGVMCAMLHLGSQPTIEERKHGHWIKLFDPNYGIIGVECSVCKGEMRRAAEYCPFCGAIMDEVK